MIGEMEHRLPNDLPAVARYREFVPCDALRPHVRALFAFTLPAGTDAGRRPLIRETVFRAGQPFWSGLFADGHASVVFSFGGGYSIDGLWHPGEHECCGHLIGAMSRARAASHGGQLIQVGAYLRPGAAAIVVRAAASEFTDRVVSLADLWGGEVEEMDAEILEGASDVDRITRLERSLLRRIRHRESRTSSIDAAGLAAAVVKIPGPWTAENMAHAAGVSRQQLTRVFRERIGITPKLYCRLARFHTVLKRAGKPTGRDWVRIAAETGYVDQSHMIADFRRFSGATPAQLVERQLFHPFC